MNRMLLCSAFVLLAIAGCGKKKESVLDSAVQNKTNAAKNDIPLFPSEKEEATSKKYEIGDFAFEDNDAEPAVAQNNGNMIDEDADLEQLLVADADDAQDESDANAAFRRVQFDFNKNSIRKDQQLAVREDVELAKQAVAQGKEIVVQGHTCQMGSAAYNLALSQRRADAVKKEMVKNGIPSTKVKTVGFGYESPLVWSESADRTQKIKELAVNRRAEVVAAR